MLSSRRMASGPGRSSEQVNAVASTSFRRMSMGASDSDVLWGGDQRLATSLERMGRVVAFV